MQWSSRAEVMLDLRIADSKATTEGPIYVREKNLATRNPHASKQN
jgi:hypothetical protein